MGIDLGDAAAYGQAYDQHSRGAYAAAFRILGNAAQAQDVVQDVFLRLWRRPQSFDSGRGELGSYVRMMARSRALDLWREGQAAGRASDRLKLVVADEEPRPQERPGLMAERDEQRATLRAGLARLPYASARRSCWPTGAG